MSIDYVKRTRPAQPAPQSSQAHRELAYAVEQYDRLTAELQQAQVVNNDKWRKENVNLRGLYSQRAAAAAQMARWAKVVLTEG